MRGVARALGCRLPGPARVPATPCELDPSGQIDEHLAEPSGIHRRKVLPLGRRDRDHRPAIGPADLVGDSRHRVELLPCLRANDPVGDQPVVALEFPDLRLCLPSEQAVHGLELKLEL